MLSFLRYTTNETNEVQTALFNVHTSQMYSSKVAPLNSKVASSDNHPLLDCALNSSGNQPDLVVLLFLLTTSLVWLTEGDCAAFASPLPSYILSRPRCHGGWDAIEPNTKKYQYNKK